MSDAAQKVSAVVLEHPGRVKDGMIVCLGCVGVAPIPEFKTWREYADHLATLILAVLSETHAVVELDREDTHYGVAVDTSSGREVAHIGETREHCENVVTGMRWRDREMPMESNAVVVSRVVAYGPWTPVAEGGDRRG